MSRKMTTAVLVAMVMLFILGIGGRAFAASEREELISVEFGSEPLPNTTVTMTISITPTTSVTSTEIMAYLPDDMDFHGAHPVHDTYDGNWITWSGIDLIEGQDQVIEVSVESTSEFEDVVRIQYTETQPQGWYDHQEVAYQIRVTSSNYELEQGYPGYILDQTETTEERHTGSLGVTTSIYPLPAGSSGVTTITIGVRNDLSSPSNFVAVLSLPFGWIADGSDEGNLLYGGVEEPNFDPDRTHNPVASIDAVLTQEQVEWSGTLQPAQTFTKTLEISHVGTGDWRVGLEVYESNRPVTSITYGGETQSAGSSIGGAFYGSEVSQGPCTETETTGCDSQQQNPCEMSTIEFDGVLKYEIGGVGSGSTKPSQITLIELEFLGNPFAFSCPSKSYYTIYTNTSNTGSYHFGPLLGQVGWYRFKAYATDATSPTHSEFATWVVAPNNGCNDVDCANKRYSRFMTTFYFAGSSQPVSVDLGEYVVPKIATSGMTFGPDFAPGEAFWIQSRIAAVSSPTIDNLSIWSTDHWDARQGVFRTRGIFPVSGLGGFAQYKGKGNIHFGAIPDEEIIHHEYGHHALNVQYELAGGPFGPPTHSGVLGEGWSNYFAAQCMNSTKFESHNGTYWDKCIPTPEPSNVGNLSQEARRAAAAFWDLQDGENECFDTAEYLINEAYHYIALHTPSTMCGVLDIWPQGAFNGFEDAEDVWKYSKFNRFSEGEIPGCQ